LDTGVEEGQIKKKNWGDSEKRGVCIFRTGSNQSSPISNLTPLLDPPNIHGRFYRPNTISQVMHMILTIQIADSHNMQHK